MPPLTLEVTTLVAAVTAFRPFVVLFRFGGSLSSGRGSNCHWTVSRRQGEKKGLLESWSTSMASISGQEQSAAATRGLEGVDRSAAASEQSGMLQSIGSLSHRRINRFEIEFAQSSGFVRGHRRPAEHTRPRALCIPTYPG